MAATITKTIRLGKKNDQGEAPIYFRLTKGRRSSYIATSLRNDPKYWDDKQRRVKPSHPNSAQANAYLDKEYYKIQDKFLEDERENRDSSVKMVKEKVTGTKTTDFFQVAQTLLDRYGSANKINTHDTFKSTVNKVRSFCKVEVLPLSQISQQFLALFEQHLISIGNKANTIHKDLKGIRRVFNAAYRLGN